MNRSQQLLLAQLGPEWRTAREIRDAIAPGTSLANIRMRIGTLRRVLGDQIEIESEHDVGPASRGYRLVRSEVAA